MKTERELILDLYASTHVEKDMFSAKPEFDAVKIFDIDFDMEDIWDVNARIISHVLRIQNNAAKMFSLYTCDTPSTNEFDSYRIKMYELSKLLLSATSDLAANIISMLLHRQTNGKKFYEIHQEDFNAAYENIKRYFEQVKKEAYSQIGLIGRLKGESNEKIEEILHRSEKKLWEALRMCIWIPYKCLICEIKDVIHYDETKKDRMAHQREQAKKVFRSNLNKTVQTLDSASSTDNIPNQVLEPSLRTLLKCFKLDAYNYHYSELFDVLLYDERIAEETADDLRETVTYIENLLGIDEIIESYLTLDLYIREWHEDPLDRYDDLTPIYV